MNDRFVSVPGITLSDILTNDLRGLNLQLKRIKPPYEVARSFSIPLENDEFDVVESFIGVIAFHHELHEFHANPGSDFKKAPECFSYDGISGCGNPGGLCSTCPRRLYKKDFSKPVCKDKRRLYIIRPGELLPYELTIPNVSMQNFSLYLRHLIGQYQLPGRVVTRFSMKRQPNSVGVQVSKIFFDMVRPLDNEELAYIQSTAPAIEEFMQRELDDRKNRSRSYGCSAD